MVFLGHKGTTRDTEGDKKQAVFIDVFYFVQENRKVKNRSGGERSNPLRVLVCGKTMVKTATEIYLHVVCEYADPVCVEFVTAYIPDEQEWESPPFRRRKQKT
jgi:hypothetical protein